MKILITGSSGLLGSYLFEFLKMNGESVKRFNRNKLSYRNNQTNIDQLIGFDCIIHAAANTNVEACEIDPISCYKDNTLLTERLAYAAGKAKCKFIYISSTGIYGTGKKSEPFTEYDEVKPTTPTGTRDWYVKWLSMILAVLGVFLISASYTLYGQVTYLLSAIGWIYVGMQWGDRAIMIGSSVSCTAIAMNLVNTLTLT